VALTPQERIGTRIADTYRLDRVIGRGGMGVVFAARHVRTQRPVAVKLLAPENAAQRARFLREAKILGEADHPNVVEVIDLGEEADRTVYIVLELLSGEPLSTLIARQGKLDAIGAIDVALPVMDALASLHEAGIVHRDVKPANVFLALDGVGSVVPKLLDFGISRKIESTESLTHSGMLIGTPEYMSPEQVRADEAATPASDVWSMGVVLYECLAGCKPFTASTVGGIIAKIVSERPAPLVERAPDLAPEIAREVERALAPSPEARHRTMRAFAEALERAALDAGLDLLPPAGARLAIEPVSERPVPATVDAEIVPASRPAAKWPIALAAGAAIAIAVAGAFAVSTHEGAPARARVEPTEPSRLSVESAPEPVRREAEVPSPAPVIAEPAVPGDPPPQRAEEDAAPENSREVRPRRPRRAPIVEPTRPERADPPEPAIEVGPNDAPILPN
jgi:eukaryotic-like serine/threonine-protein kinase